MISIWLVFAVLTGIAVFAVLWPLSRAPATSDARELDVAFYEAQTAEIDRDTTRGVLGAQEAETARNEAARRLMAARQRATPDVARGSVLATRAVALGSLIFVPAVAIGLYDYVGAPSLPDDPLEARFNVPAAQMDMATAIAKIERHLVKDPDDGRGWSVIAPIYTRLGRPDDAARAYKNEIRILGPTSDRYAALGEVRVLASDNLVTPDAKADFEKAVAIDPKSPRGNFYLGLAAQQNGDAKQAVAIWTKLVDQSPPDAPWLTTVRNHIAEASGAPPAAAPSPTVASDGPPRGKMADAIAAMPGAQQQAMIHRMVDGLADRLHANGNDIEGWLRLVRAYRVLDEQDKARLALGDARHQFAGDPTATKRLDDLAQELGLNG